MTNEVSAEQQAELEARWTTAHASLVPKLRSFAETLEPGEQEVLGYLLHALQPEGDDTAGYAWGPIDWVAYWNRVEQENADAARPTPILALGRTEMPRNSSSNLTRPNL